MTTTSRTTTETIIRDDYEIHVTVGNANKETFITDCETYRVKPLYLQNWLENGSENHFLTSESLKSITYPEAREKMEATVQYFIDKGYTINRKKIETRIGNYEQVPQSYWAYDDKNVSYINFVYFEVHFKVVLPKTVNAISEYLDFKMGIDRVRYERELFISSSLLKPEENSNIIIFTRRYPRENRMGPNDVIANTNDLKRFLKHKGLAVKDATAEACVYDSNIGLDTEWMNKQRSNQELELEPSIVPMEVLPSIAEMISQVEYFTPLDISITPGNTEM